MMRQSINETFRRDSCSSELGISTAWNSRDVFLAQAGQFLNVSFPRPRVLEQKDVNKEVQL